MPRKLKRLLVLATMAVSAVAVLEQLHMHITLISNSYITP